MVEIIKNNGETEKFKPEKLKKSLIRSGASVKVSNTITKDISSELKDGMTTSDIYKKAFKLLDKEEKISAIKYSVKRSIISLGPSGFPFEKFIAELFEAQGYKTKIGLFLKGKCIEHEIDTVAYKNKELILSEIKFHNKLGIKTDTKVVLYVKSRFDDLKKGEFLLNGVKRKMTSGLLITNTKFTNTAKKYAECSGGVKLISWDYPPKGNLYDLIEKTAIHPITCIPQLKNKEKAQLLDIGIVNCNSLIKNKKILEKIGVEKYKIKEIIDNIDIICSHSSHK